MLVRRVLRRLGLRSEDALHLPQLVHGQQRKHLRHWRQLRGGHGLRPMRVLLSLVRGLLLWRSQCRRRGQILAWRHSEPLLLPHGG